LDDGTHRACPDAINSVLSGIFGILSFINLTKTQVRQEHAKALLGMFFGDFNKC
jgi:hypothetical protein